MNQYVVDRSIKCIYFQNEEDYRKGWRARDAMMYESLELYSKLFGVYAEVGLSGLRTIALGSNVIGGRRRWAGLLLLWGTGRMRIVGE
jgi:hypothetical protein